MVELDQLDQLLTPGQVSELLGISTRQVQRLVDTRRIPFIKVGVLNRFIPSEIQAWLQANHRPVQPRRKYSSMGNVGS